MLSWQHTFGASVALTQVLWHGSKPANESWSILKPILLQKSPKPSRKISQGCPRTVQNQKGWHPMEVAETKKTQWPKILRHNKPLQKKTHVPHLFANAPSVRPDQTIRWRPQAVAGWGAFLATVAIRQRLGFTALGLEKRWSKPQQKTTIPKLQKPSFVGRWACDVPIDYPETVISVHSVPILAG